MPHMTGPKINRYNLHHRTPPTHLKLYIKDIFCWLDKRMLFVFKYITRWLNSMAYYLYLKGCLIYVTQLHWIEAYKVCLNSVCWFYRSYKMEVKLTFNCFHLMSIAACHYSFLYDTKTAVIMLSHSVHFKNSS